MATDNTPPRLRLIVTIAIIMVITLVSLDFVFRSYYAFMSDQAKHEKLAPRTELLAQLLLEHEAFAAAKTPIDKAMGEVAKGSRPELIEPKPSDDPGPMTGWSKLPKPAPLLVPTPNDVRPATALDAGALDTDAGAMAPEPHTRDGGAPARPHDDAGASRAPAVKDAGAHAPH